MGYELLYLCSMKKVVYDSWLAKRLLMKGYDTITVGPLVFTKLKVLPQWVMNHECVHVRQWTEMAFVSGFLLLIGMIVFSYSPWLMFVSPATFYMWYFVEYIVRRVWGLFINGDQKQAYRSVWFEREARRAERDPHYLENSGCFEWVGK